MKIEPRPPWLVSQENGVLAESRTRAFLADRFWVLERSVDIEGADFIIQRRLTGKSLLDKTPPTLGFVQAKFFGNPGTTQYLHREYVVDSDGSARSEFFLVCHTGTEDESRFFVLSATDVMNTFAETSSDHSKPARFALPGTRILCDEFEVLDKTAALDRIERALRDADFYKNRSFLSWALPQQVGDRPPILGLYEEPIENWWGDIPKGFETLRDAARRASYDFEEVLQKLRDIEGSSDPEQALDIADDIRREWGQSVGISDRLYDRELHAVVLQHKRRYQQLAAVGLLSAHAALRRIAEAYANKQLAPVMPLPRDKVYVLTVRYDADTFRNVRCDGRIGAVSQLWPNYEADRWGHQSDIPDTCGVLEAEKGCIDVYLAAGRYAYVDIGERGVMTPQTGPWSEQVRPIVRIMIGKLLDAVLVDRFGEV